jgi:CubicO group peptidase (beta-lactamase class C family)
MTGVHAASFLLVGSICLSLLPAPPVTPQAGFAAARDAASELPRLRSLLVSWRGTRVVEYFAQGAGRARHTNVKSVSKSVISALVGIAIERGYLKSVNQPIGPYFPEHKLDQRKSRITIEDLLTMRAGLESTSFDNYGAWVGSRNWVGYVLSRPLQSEPGTSMEYSTGNSHLLSAILTKATGRTTWAFAQETLAKPLGFTLGQWPRDPQGIYFGGNDMVMTPDQMLAFGQLYLSRGLAGGRQVVPAAWVETSCVPRGRSRFNPDQSYGIGWWMRDFRGREGCFAWGYGGQYIMVFRDLDLVIVTTSATTATADRHDHRRQIFDIVERHILPEAERGKR